jgi:tRNA (guanosine-2'-O-)-methyltransferase
VAGGGPKYEEAGKRPPPEPDELLLDTRKERIEQVLALRTRTLTVVLDRLEDTFNMAAVVRTCEGMGIQELHVIESPDVRFAPNQKVTQGCEKWVDIHLYRTFAECREALKARGFALWASAIREGGKSLFELRFDQKVALIFGNERYGVSDEVLAGSDGTFWIPMRGFTRSFNISAAASASLTRAIGWRLEHLGPSGDLSTEDAQALKDRFYLLSVKQRGRIYKGNTP